MKSRSAGYVAPGFEEVRGEFERNFTELLQQCARHIHCPDALRLRITAVLAESAPPDR